MAPNFEYYTITETNPTDATETAHILNHLGYLGWDLAATFSNPLGTHFVLKRYKDDGELLDGGEGVKRQQVVL